MQNDYLSFLDYRAAQRRLASQFSRPRWLILHTLAFIISMTAIWAYGIAWKLWYYQDNFRLPVFIGVVWSLLLAAHALFHYIRSPARAERRELAVEEAMRQFIQNNDNPIDHDTLFAMHRDLESDLVTQGRWSAALLAFALVNLISWAVSAFDIGTSWPFQMTLPLAIITLSGVNLLLNWQHQRRMERSGWFARLPLWHVVAYGAGVIALGIAGMYGMINGWDANTLIKGWSIVILLHILINVIVWPLLQRLMSSTQDSSGMEKRKPSARLVLSDDGEVLEIDDIASDSMASQA